MALDAVLLGAGAASGSSVSTSAGTSAAGSRFAVCVAWDSPATISSVSDSKGNTYTAVGLPADDGGTGLLQWYYSEGGATGAGHTATVVFSAAARPSVSHYAISDGPPEVDEQYFLGTNVQVSTTTLGSAWDPSPVASLTTVPATSTGKRLSVIAQWSFMFGESTTVVSVSDSKGNTYTQVYGDSGLFFYEAAPTVFGAAHTATVVLSEPRDGFTVILNEKEDDVTFPSGLALYPAEEWLQLVAYSRNDGEDEDYVEVDAAWPVVHSQGASSTYATQGVLMGTGAGTPATYPSVGRAKMGVGYLAAAQATFAITRHVIGSYNPKLLLPLFEDGLFSTGGPAAELQRYEAFGALPPSAPTLKVWNGSAWVAKPVKVWTGAAWEAKTVKVWNGSSWV